MEMGEGALDHPADAAELGAVLRLATSDELPDAELAEETRHSCFRTVAVSMKRKKPEALSSSSGCFRLYADTRLCAGVPSGRGYGVRVSSQSSAPGSTIAMSFDPATGSSQPDTARRKRSLEVGDRIEVGGRP